MIMMVLTKLNLKYLSAGAIVAMIVFWFSHIQLVTVAIYNRLCSNKFVSMSYPVKCAESATTHTVYTFVILLAIFYMGFFITAVFIKAAEAENQEKTSNQEVTQ